jgi:hypothetical protein
MVNMMSKKIGKLTAVVSRSKMTSTKVVACLSLLLLSTLLFQSQLLLANVATAQSSPTTSNFITFDGSKYGFSIEYPENWNITQDAKGVWFSSPVDGTGNIRVESQPAQNLSLTDLVQVQLLQTKDSNKDFNVISSNITTLDGNPANRTDYKFKVEVPKFLGADLFDYNAIQISAVKDNTLYTVTYFADPETFYIFLPIMQKMLGTLKIPEPTTIT